LIVTNVVKNSGNYGIYIYDQSNKNTITGNDATNNVLRGIGLGTSSENDIQDNVVTSNKDHGIWLSKSCDNMITYNVVRDGGNCGIYLYDKSNGNTITDNDVINNTQRGMAVSTSSGNNIRDNVVTSNKDHGIWLSKSCDNRVTSNVVRDSGNCGVYLYERSNSNTITDNDVTHNTQRGIALSSSNTNEIRSNVMDSNQDRGIYLSKSHENVIVTNTVRNSGTQGIYISGLSKGNQIYLNNFINNTPNVHSYKSVNIWNSTEQVTYSYNGNTYRNYTGNYWDNYTDFDNRSDGIWDNPYIIDNDNTDFYPLKEQFENYYIKENQTLVFDTGEPDNPYPSVCGTHEGTITADQTITVRKLYTYPCPGTGGHAEHVKFWNASWDGAEGHGDGHYTGDWHNISFGEFVLYKAETYNYTICTGSYPQIIHTPTLTNGYGTITSTIFTDTNGRVYKDRIPAIKLFDSVS